jgi:hypothetical protein
MAVSGLVVRLAERAVTEGAEDDFGGFASMVVGHGK